MSSLSKAVDFHRFYFPYYKRPTLGVCGRRILKLLLIYVISALELRNFKFDLIKNAPC